MKFIYIEAYSKSSDLQQKDVVPSSRSEPSATHREAFPIIWKIDLRNFSLTHAINSIPRKLVISLDMPWEKNKRRATGTSVCNLQFEQLWICCSD